MDYNGLWTFLAVISPAVIILLVSGILLALVAWWCCK